MSRTTADSKVDLGREKVRQWGAAMARGQWDWDALGHALQYAHEAIDSLPTYQRPWNLLADVYHRIGKVELAKECLKRSLERATPGPNFPGRFHREVQEHIRTGYPFSPGGGVARQQPPQWFESKYQRYWTTDQYVVFEPPAPGAPPIATVFISYAREDHEAAERLREDLSARGIAAWKDTHDLLPGQKWEEVIAETIRQNDFVIVCLSNMSIRKAGFFHEEIRMALRWQSSRPSSVVYLIPARLERCEIPPELRPYHSVDLFADWMAGISAMEASIRQHH